MPIVRQVGEHFKVNQEPHANLQRKLHPQFTADVPSDCIHVFNRLGYRSSSDFILAMIA